MLSTSGLYPRALGPCLKGILHDFGIRAQGYTSSNYENRLPYKTRGLSRIGAFPTLGFRAARYVTTHKGFPFSKGSLGVM